MNIKQAFIYPFKPEKWYPNIILGTCICLPLAFATYIITITNKDFFSGLYIFLFCISIICKMVTSIFIDGYICTNANSRIITGNTNPISWKDNIDTIIFSGLKALCGTLIYKIPILLISAFLFLTHITSIYNTIITPNYNFPSYLFITTCTLIFLIDITTLPAFITNLKFKSFFDYKLMKNIITKNFSGFILLIITFLLIALVYKYLQTILSMPSIIFVLLNAFVIYYIALIKSDIYTQYIKEKI